MIQGWGRLRGEEKNISVEREDLWRGNDLSRRKDSSWEGAKCISGKRLVIGEDEKGVAQTIKIGASKVCMYRSPKALAGKFACVEWRGGP